MRTLTNDLQRVLPNAIRINRGKLSIEGAYEEALGNNADRIIVVERWKGGPGSLKLYALPFTPKTFTVLQLSGVKLQDEFGQKMAIHKGLVVTVDRGASPQAKDLAEFLSEFLKIPILSVLPAEAKASMHFSAQGNKIKISVTMPPTIKEVGPTLIVENVENFGEHNS